MLVSPDGKFKFEYLDESQRAYAVFRELEKFKRGTAEYTANQKAVYASCGWDGSKLFDPNAKPTKPTVKENRFTITAVKDGKAYITDWVDGCHSCAINLETGNIVAYVTVDGYGEWCGVRPLTETEKEYVFADVQKFLAKSANKAERQARAIENVRKAGITRWQLSDYEIPEAWADLTQDEIIDAIMSCE